MGRRAEFRACKTTLRLATTRKLSVKKHELHSPGRGCTSQPQRGHHQPQNGYPRPKQISNATVTPTPGLHPWSSETGLLRTSILWRRAMLVTSFIVVPKSVLFENNRRQHEVVIGVGSAKVHGLQSLQIHNSSLTTPGSHIMNRNRFVFTSPSRWRLSEGIVIAGGS